MISGPGNPDTNPPTVLDDVMKGEIGLARGHSASPNSRQQQAEAPS